MDVFSALYQDSNYWDGTTSWGGFASQAERDAHYTGGGFTTINSWVEDRDGKSSAGDREVLEIIGTWDTPLQESHYDIDGFNADSVKITAIGDARHEGKWSSSKFIWELTAPSYSGIDIEHPTELEGLQVRSIASNSNLRTFEVSDNGVVELNNCLVTITGSTALSFIYFRSDVDGNVANNSVFLGQNTVGVGIYKDGSGSVSFYNSIVKGCIKGINGTNDANIIVKNCAVYNNNDDFTYCTHGVIDHNASDNGDGTNSVQPLNWGNVFIDAANFDFHLKETDTDLNNAGIGPDADSNVPTTDIDSDSRSGSTCNIGIDEFAISPGTSVLVSDAGEGADDLLNSILLGIAEAGAGVDGFAGDAAVNQFDSGAGFELIKNIASNLIISDLGAGADLINVLSELFLSVADAGVGLDDLANIATTLFLNDIATGNELIGSLIAKVTISESGIGNDLIAKIIKGIVVSDQAVGVDIISELAASAAISDSGSGLDLIKSILNRLLIPDQSIGLDIINSLLASCAIVDLAAGTDSVSIIYEALILISDSGTATDEINSIVNEFILSDLANGGDNLTTTVLANVLDAGASVDTVAGILTNLIIADIGDGVEAISVLKNILLHITDAASGADVVSEISAYCLQQDDAAGIEFINLVRKLISVSDSAAGADVLKLITEKLIKLADSAAGADLISSIIVILGLTDVAYSVEAVKANVFTAIQDFGAGFSDIEPIIAEILQQDFGAGVDLVTSVFNSLNIRDIGLGNDTAILYGRVLDLVARYYIRAKRETSVLGNEKRTKIRDKRNLTIK